MTPSPYEVEPVGGPLDAVVRVPGSKSITNRALLAAALAGGRSRLTGALFADDTEAMLDALGRLGAGIDADRSAGLVSVDGMGGRLAPGPVTIDARQSGTTARFLLPVLAAAAGAGRYELDGHPQLRRRPMGPGIEALRTAGATVEERGEPGHLPLAVRGGGVRSPVRVGGDVSSQFLSGLLLAGPLVPGGLAIEVTTPLVSRPYVDLTVGVMASFGIEVVNEPVWFLVPPGGYRAGPFEVEPDASTASYFLAAAAVCGGRVTVPGLSRRSRQGDIAFLELLGRMGAEVEWDGDGSTVRMAPGAELRGIEADLSAISDTAPTLAVVAAFASGPSRVSGIGFIRRKETDRIAAVVRELRRCGIDATEEDDGFTVRPGPDPITAATIEPDDDHRIAMAFALVGLRVPGISIAEPDCVAKTFPGFWDALALLTRQ
jgi:3-phosphoshikimate 1-carboxyvinyltransferase